MAALRGGPVYTTIYLNEFEARLLELGYPCPSTVSLESYASVINEALWSSPQAFVPLTHADGLYYALAMEGYRLNQALGKEKADDKKSLHLAFEHIRDNEFRCTAMPHQRADLLTIDNPGIIEYGILGGIVEFTEAALQGLERRMIKNYGPPAAERLVAGPPEREVEGGFDSDLGFYHEHPEKFDSVVTVKLYPKAALVTFNRESRSWNRNRVICRLDQARHDRLLAAMNKGAVAAACWALYFQDLADWERFGIKPPPVTYRGSPSALEGLDPRGRSYTLS
jgi:hypothetical protein